MYQNYEPTIVINGNFHGEIGFLQGGLHSLFTYGEQEKQDITTIRKHIISEIDQALMPDC